MGGGTRCGRVGARCGCLLGLTSGVEAAPIVQLTASAAGRQDMRLQDMRLHDGRVYLTLGCDMECSVYAHGHLNLLRGRRHLGLRRVLTTLEPGHAMRIALSLSHANLSAVHRALQHGESVKAAVEVQATSGDGRTDTPGGGDPCGAGGTTSTMRAMESSNTPQPAAIESRPEDDTSRQADQRDLESLNFEQLIVPGLGSGPILPEWLSKLFRRKDTSAVAGSAGSADLDAR